MKWRKGKSEGSTMPLSEFSPVVVEHLEDPPNPTGRWIMAMIMLFAALTIAWLYFAKIEVLVSAQGMVVPAGRARPVQAPDAAVVKQVHVRDGQHVIKDEILIELDATMDEADRRRLKQEIMEDKVKLARLKAQYKMEDGFVAPEGADPDIVDEERKMLTARLSQIRAALSEKDSEIERRRAEKRAIEAEVSRLQATLPLLRARFEKKRRLAKKGYVTEVELVDARLEMINSEKDLEVRKYRLGQARAALNLAIAARSKALAEFRSTTLVDIDELSEKVAKASEELVKASRRTMVRALRAPVDGVVQQLSVNHAGAVVTAAQQLLVVVPDGEKMEVEARLLNKDAGFVHEGQPVHVKVEAYQFTKYGSLDGTVQWVGRDAIMDENTGPVYPARIALASEVMPVRVNGQDARIKPGMQVSVDIVIGGRRVLEYFLDPILKHSKESLHER